MDTIVEITWSDEVAKEDVTESMEKSWGNSYGTSGEERAIWGQKESAVTETEKVEVVSSSEFCRESKENEVLQKDIGVCSVLITRGEAGQLDLMIKRWWGRAGG